MTFVICKSSDPHWLDERRKRITASDMNVWLGTQPSFYEETKGTLIGRKLTGERADFGDRSTRRMAHGREREPNALHLAGTLFGFPTTPYGYLIGNERWPYLAATLDGLLFPWVGREPDYRLTSQEGHMAEVRSIIEHVGQPVMCEVKVSDSGHRYKDKSGPTAGKRAWIDYSPAYHFEQIQTGLWMAGLEHALLVGCLGGDDLICWYHTRQERWAEVMDEANAEAEEVLRPLWEATTR